MNNGIYAVVKRYENDKYEFTDWYYKPDNHYSIYDRMMKLTNNNHELSSDAASWCELATVGEIYEFENGEIEIQEID